MHDICILYASQYGSTRAYAHWLAEALGAGCYDIRQASADALAAADTVLLCGGLYAGRMNGAKFAPKHADTLKSKRLAFVAVGASPVTADTLEAVRTGYLPEGWRDRPCFYLRGGLDVPNMKWGHRAMMNLLRRTLLKKPAEQRTEWEVGLLASYDGAHDWTDVAAIQPIVQWARAQ